MDGNPFLLFLLATFLGGFVSGFSRFAMGRGGMIAGYGLPRRATASRKLRHELSWQSIWPLTLGTAIGIPIGVMLLTHINSPYLRFGVGLLLVLFATYSLARPPIKPMKIGTPADVAIGISNGLLGGLTGLGGIISTISCQWRGWSKDKQRSVFQPVLFAAFVIISIAQLIAGSYTIETLKLYGIGLPFMVAGIWIGFKLYGTIDDQTFRKTVLTLVLLAGVSLIVSAWDSCLFPKVEIEGITPMNSNSPSPSRRSIAIVWRGDAAARKAATSQNNRFVRVFEASPRRASIPNQPSTTKTFQMWFANNCWQWTACSFGSIRSIRARRAPRSIRCCVKSPCAVHGSARIPTSFSKWASRMFLNTAHAI